MAPQSAKKGPRPPQVGNPNAAPDVDRPGQGDDEKDRKNQADGHHDTAERHERLTKSGRLNTKEIKRVLEESDEGNQ
jgi:hypothetical protein